MPRKPPQKNRAAHAGPVPTNKLPNNPDARKTWTGDPKQRSGRWSGSTQHGGAKHHVGTFDTPRAWGEARDALLVALRAGAGPTTSVPATALDGVSIAEFVGADGEKWPWDFNPQGDRRQPQTMRHHEQCVRPLLRDFGDRPIKGGIGAEEVDLFANGATENMLTSVIAMFNDAHRRDKTVENPFAGLGRPRTKGRRDLDGVLTPEEFALLRQTARSVHAGIYEPVMDAMLVVMGTSGARCGELWAMERDEFYPDDSEYNIYQAVKKDGRLGIPKYDQKRRIVLTPEAVQALLAVPVLHERWLLPSKTGRLMSQTNWTTYWHPVREAFTAQLPESHWLRRRIARCAQAKANEPDPKKRRRMSDGKLDFYELKHRAITDMVTPAPDGLGIDPQDAAQQVGHTDGGKLIQEIYLHLNPDKVRARIKAALGHTDAAESCGAGETGGQELS